jgi:hypothetical protein
MYTPKITCHVHPKYKAIRKPRPGCVLCHAMWQDKLVFLERQAKQQKKHGGLTTCDMGEDESI